MDPDRRQFLKTTTAIAAGSILPASASAPETVAAVTEAATSTTPEIIPPLIRLLRRLRQLEFDEGANDDRGLRIGSNREPIPYESIILEAMEGKTPAFFTALRRSLEYQTRFLFEMLEDAKEAAPCFAHNGPLSRLTNMHKGMQMKLTAFLRDQLTRMPEAHLVMKKVDEHLSLLQMDHKAGISPTVSPEDAIKEILDSERAYRYSKDPESPYQRWQNILKSYRKEERNEKAALDKIIVENAEALKPIGINNRFILESVQEARHWSRFVSLDPFIHPGTHPSTTTLLHYDPTKHNAASVQAKLQSLIDSFYNRLCSKAYSMGYDGKLPGVPRGEGGIDRVQAVCDRLKKQMDEMIKETVQEYQQPKSLEPDYWTRRVHEGMTHEDAERYSSFCRD